MDIIKISVLGFSGMILGVLLKECKPEYSFYISLACGLCILLLASSKISYIIESLQKIQSNLPMDASYLNILLKMVGLTYIGQFSSSLCRDSGYSAIAGQIEVFCKLSLMVISMPVLLTLLEVIQGFLA